MDRAERLTEHECDQAIQDDVVKVISKRHNGHQAIEVDGETYCGQSWCGGECGLQALVVQYDNPDLGTREARARGSAVACGPVFASFRVPWTGGKKYVADTENKDALFKMMWW